MKFKTMLEIVGNEPLFETSLLLAGDVEVADVQRQLSRWTQAGRIYQLRRGLYALAPPFQKIKPHPFFVANRMVRPSYVSVHSALAHYGLIPEYVPVATSVTRARPGRWDTPLGSCTFRHLKAELFQGYRLLEVGGGQQAFVASAEKALLDLIYLEPGADSPDYLQELRLQNLDQFKLDKMQEQADLAGSPKLQRAVVQVVALARSEMKGYETL